MKIIRRIYYFFKSRELIKKHAYPREKNEDRDILERVIFPYILASYNPKTVLDIGREDYQKFYNDFFAKKELWTLDIDPRSKSFGAKNHITDDAANLKNHFEDNYFDFILMNGVFGWGLNNEKKIQKTFAAIHAILKPGGVFVFGWNDDIVPLQKIKGLNKLKPLYFKPLKTDRFKCINGNHTYNFYTKE